MEINNEKNSEQLIIDYVVKKISEGTSGDEIKKQLHAVGWSDDEIDSIYATGLTQCGVPAPVKGDDKIFSKKSTAGEIVVNIFSFVVLGFIATSLGILFYNVIDYFFTDEIVGAYRKKVSSSSIHYAIAVLIVGFPMYYFSMKFWFRRFKRDEGKVESLLTKWITYIILLIGVITVVGDLVAVLFYFLQGEITVKFFLKALVILIISGGIFGFYFFERKRIQYKKNVSKQVFYSFAMVTIFFIVIAIIAGFSVAGSPATERSRAFDKTRSSNLNSIANCINRYSKEYESLPKSLDFIEDVSGYSNCGKNKDPKTNEKYEYNITSELKEKNGVIEGEFELCATFELVADENTLDADSSSVYYNKSSSKWEDHSVGQNCDREKIMIKKEAEIKFDEPQIYIQK